VFALVDDVAGLRREGAGVESGPAGKDLAGFGVGEQFGG
jgi:hypothetical protein